MAVDFGARTANKAKGGGEGNGGNKALWSTLARFCQLSAQTNNVAVFRIVLAAVVVVVVFFCQPLATCHMALATQATLDKVLKNEKNNEQQQRQQQKLAVIL